MSYLRAATSERHRRLEERLNPLRPDFTSSDYKRLLERFYGFWKPWEELVGRVPGVDFRSFFHERQRAAKARRDLEQLGLSDAATSFLPLAKHLPALFSTEAALGSMYVSEGSTLGGQLLSRHFIESVGIRPDQCTFFLGYGPETGRMWKRFGNELSKQPPSSFSEMATAANETFECLEEWLCP